jgi:hypothetical protein
MDVYHKILIAIAIGLVLFGAFLGYEWLQAHDAALRAEAKVAADQAAFDKLTAQQKELADQLKQVQKDQADGLATVGRQFGAAQSSPQFAALLAQLIGLKTTPTVVTPIATADNPRPTPVVELPDSPPVRAYFKDCEDCKVNYAAAQKAAAIADQNRVAAETKLSLVTDERDQWKKTATGGSWKRRAATRLGHFVVDAGIIAIVACGSGHCK